MCANKSFNSNSNDCFTLSALLVFLPFRNWACWLLSTRRVASPKAQTTPFWRNCTADMQWVHKHERKRTSHTCTPCCTDIPSLLGISQDKARPPTHHQNILNTAFTAQITLPRRGEHFSRWMKSTAAFSALLHVGRCTTYMCPRAALTCKHNTETWSLFCVCV